MGGRVLPAHRLIIMIAVIDYGAGNLRSVANAVARLGYEPVVTSNARDVREAPVVIMPGVGAAADTMFNLRKHRLVTAVRQRIVENKPFFGVCMGLQVLCSRSEEGGGCECLSIIPGQVRKLPPGLKVPHMGWNQVRQKVNHPIFNGIPDGTNFYFVHSYYVAPDDKNLVAGETEYGITFCSMLVQGNLVATQFHPEKSGEFGLKMYDNFIKSALGNK
ncbi:MAG: imidazole glycerol phosphate synthase subunit HisH [Dehalococcoidales bacterium]|nr:imidazole glycerol phosphate synthase subunit HisH [Dehalococcoidales bacterium]